MSFRCDGCQREYIPDGPIKHVIPRTELKTQSVSNARILCSTCYEIAMRILQDKKQHESWQKYCMSE